MRRALTGVVVAISICIEVSPSTAAVVEPPIDAAIVIRTYDSTTFPHEDRAAAIVVATAILEAAGLDVVWLVCDATSVRGADDPCMAPLGANELAIRFMRLPLSMPHGDEGSLDYSLVDTRKGTGAFATIFVDRVTRLASRWGVAAGTLLGRASAHEIGHLLLGTASHATSGLMRAVWTRDTLRRDRAYDWLFSIRDGRAPREAVRRRLAW